jgi:ATP synthase protein I
MSENEKKNPSGDSGRGAEGALWSIFAYLLSGLLVWGGIGYGLDYFFEREIFTLIGLLLGMGSALYLVWMRFGRK